MSNYKIKDIVSEYNKIFGVEDSYQAPSKIMEVIYDKCKREELFKELL